jgi:hypothetical protein
MEEYSVSEDTPTKGYKIRKNEHVGLDNTCNDIWLQPVNDYYRGEKCKNKRCSNLNGISVKFAVNEEAEMSKWT